MRQVWAVCLVLGGLLGAGETGSWFTDDAQSLNLDFVHFNGMSGELYYPEMVGAGAALLDYDNDDDLDALVLQGSMLGPGKTLRQALFPPEPKQSLPFSARLYRNDLIPDGILHFTDVTSGSGLQTNDHGMAVATGDIDNDGYPDVYLANFGANRMYRNNGKGKFTDITDQSGTGDARWSSTVTFFDYDRDGRLDLFVGNYVEYNFTNRKECFNTSGARDYCGPLSYPPSANRLFHNLGEGRFEDVSVRTGIAAVYNGALGSVAADFNRDGWPNLFVANDGRANELWVNQKNGTFRNDALLAGCAYDLDGKARAGMGVSAGDFDNDGDEDLFITNLRNEGHILYVNDGKGWFEDRSREARIAGPALPYTGWGTGFFDFDNDNYLDLLTVNGEVRIIETLARAGDRYPLHQRNQLFRNLGNGRFADVTAQAGPVFRLSHVGRGAAFGDIDNDGDTDILVLNNNGPAQLLRNHIGNRKAWVGLRLLDAKQKRDMLGSRVAVYVEGGPVLWRHVHSDGSYASSNDPRLLVGLGNYEAVAKVRVLWPAGRIEEWEGVRAGRYSTLTEGTGKAVQ